MASGIEKRLKKEKTGKDFQEKIDGVKPRTMLGLQDVVYISYCKMS